MSLSLAPSYAVLCAVQAAVVLAPRRASGHGRLGWAWLVAPALALGAGIAVLRIVSGGPHALALVAAVAAPALAALRPRRAPVALALWLVAWLAHGLVAQAASVALIALAAVSIAELPAAVAAAWAGRGRLVRPAAGGAGVGWGAPGGGPAAGAPPPPAG